MHETAVTFDVEPYTDVDRRAWLPGSTATGRYWDVLWMERPLG